MKKIEKWMSEEKSKKAAAFLLLLMFVCSVLSSFTNGVYMSGIDLVRGIRVAEEYYIDVPFYYQVKNYYCGPAALQMVFDFYGENISQYEIADVARTVPYVTYTDELRRAAHFSNISTSMGSEMPENITGYTARKFGYAAFEMGGMTLDDLKSLIDQDFPMILLMRWVPGEEYGHYRVAVGYNETHVFLHDPWNNIEWGGDYGGPNIAMNYTFFADMWSYSGNWSLFVSPWKITINMPKAAYVGQHFTVAANITYTCPSSFTPYDYPASPCIATISLPEDLTLANGENMTKNLGDLQAGDIVQTSWDVEAMRSGNYSITVEAEGKISGFVGEKPDAGPSYNYHDRLGGYASDLINITAATQFFIGGVYPAQGAPGTLVNIYGGGATTNGTVIAFFDGSLGNETLGWTTAGLEGYWEITFTVPEASPGNYMLYVLDNETLTSDGIEFSVLATSKIYIRGIDPTQGPTGTKVRVFGGGATPNGKVVALLSGPVNQTIVTISSTGNVIIIVNMTVGWTNADDAGFWEISFYVPDVPLGNYTVYVVDNGSLTSDAIGFAVLPTQTGIKISNVSPVSGPPSTLVLISGDRATSNGEVKVYFDSISVANTTAYDWGGWSASFQVPDVEPGKYTITALDVTSNTTDTALFTVTPPPTIYVSPQEASIGSEITINGEGFSPGTGIFLTFEDLLFFTPIYTDENGEFNVTIFVPAVNSGNYTIKAVGTYYYGEPPKALANVSLAVTAGLDTLFEKMDDIQNALNQTQNSTQTAKDEASLANVSASDAKDEATAAKEAAESALAMAKEARTYALTTMIFAIITAALSATILVKKKQT